MRKTLPAAEYRSANEDAEYRSANEKAGAGGCTISDVRPARVTSMSPLADAGGGAAVFPLATAFLAELPQP
ncbi:MAG TPA: hypothetical protein VH684_22600 [Xanthobacteraceae bacterium]